ncbi:hypothetical protein [Flavitalea sp.]|nr:hypothetical protein [Flavitalea sp.]
MEFESFKNSIKKFVQFADLDLEKLTAIAEEKVAQEIEESRMNGIYIAPPPTTDPHGKGYEPVEIIETRCTIPISMVCFSVIDFIGSLLTRDKTDNEKDSFLLHSRLFFQQVLERNDLDNPDSLKEFQNFYRHSIMHSYLPKSNMGIGFAVSYTYYLLSEALFERSYQGLTILNIRYLAKCTRQGLSIIKSSIENRNELAQKLFEQYAKMIEDT